MNLLFKEGTTQPQIGLTQAVTQPKIRLTQLKNALTQFTGNWWLLLSGKVSKKNPGFDVPVKRWIRRTWPK